SKDQVERMVRSARSLRQTDAIQTALKRDQAARVVLTGAGCKTADIRGMTRLSIEGDKITDEELAKAKDIVGVAEIKIGPAPRVTTNGLAQLGAPSVGRLVLTESVAPDTLAAARAFPELAELDVMSARVSDADLEQVKGLTGLGKLTISGTR